MENLNFEFQALKTSTRNEKDFLIQESFLLWLALMEGASIEGFTQEQLSVKLTENAETYLGKFHNDSDCTFIMGWMSCVAFWIFEGVFSEEDGNKLLRLAFKSSPENKLFKWAVRDQLKFKDGELDQLRIAAKENLRSYFNHGPVIEDYFKDILSPGIEL